MDNNNVADEDAPKGLVLNARILWTFSAAYNANEDKSYLEIAARAYQYIEANFKDFDYGGYYWSVGKKGEAMEHKKQIYGIAFCLYGFAEYYKATGQPEVLNAAKECYILIEKYSSDTLNGGYLEALTREWQPIGDLRLSEKDANEKKTTNT
ncbi:MAG: N-acyl-D-glucosamine 2-epimerase, partial [Chitinophagaceae bacterium]